MTPPKRPRTVAGDTNAMAIKLDSARKAFRTAAQAKLRESLAASAALRKAAQEIARLEDRLSHVTRERDGSRAYAELLERKLRETGRPF
jgi:predicted  nucleic acid-binding Zn-ribbon protein